MKDEVLAIGAMISILMVAMAVVLGVILLHFLAIIILIGLLVADSLLGKDEEEVE